MDAFDDEEQLDQDILNLFHLLHLLKVCPFANYEVYGLEWGKRQAYIYRMLTRLNNN